MRSETLVNNGSSDTELNARPSYNCSEVLLPQRSFSGGKYLQKLRRSFEYSLEFSLQQSWLSEPTPEFQPGTIQVGWCGNGFVVLAELVDFDIFTFSQRPEDPLWKMGDTFEIFIRPVGQDDYFELHIAPNNARLQMHFANFEMAVRVGGSGVFEDVIVRNELFQSGTWVFPAARRWFVFAELPWNSFCTSATEFVGSEWLASFGRYDYTRGNQMPVISSTSDHSVADFHQQAGWHKIRVC